MSAPTVHHVVLYEYVEDMLERRAPHREAHLEALRARKDRGELVMGGALGDPPHGGLLVFASEQAARGFVDEDPYGAAGLVTSRRVVPWTVVV